MSAIVQSNSPRKLKPRPAPRPPVRSTPGKPTSAPATTGFVAAFDPAELRGFDSPMGTDFFDTLGRIAAYGVSEEQARCGRPSEPRGYSSDALKVVAHIATHYLYSGGYRLAEVLFAGLAAVAPEEPYHWLGLGLTYDRQDRLPEAEAAYLAASERAPAEARPLVNLAELRVEAGLVSEARTLLARAVTLAARGGDEVLRRKAQTMLERLAVARAPQGRAG